jgi:hypothetical protein
MSKGVHSLNMRGVFLILLCLAVSARPAAAEFSGEFKGSLGSDGVVQELSLQLEREIASLHLLAAVDCEYAWGQGLQLTPRWQVRAAKQSPWSLRAGQNVDHYTSSELFRLINKNHRTVETAFAVLESEQSVLGFLHRVPLDSEDLVDVVFADNRFTLGAMSLRGLQLQFSGRQSGSAAVVQAEAGMAPLAVAAAAGWMKVQGVEHRGRVVEVSHESPHFQGSFTWQSVDPGFRSILAKTNRYQPNRRGWQLDLALPLGQGEVGVAMRRHTNQEGTREYNRLAWTAKFGERFRVEWRFQPTKSLILRHTADGSLWQFDAVNYVLRHDRELGSGSWSVRGDFKRRIGRLEVQWSTGLEWRLVLKYDFLRKLAHCFLRVRYGGDNLHAQLELGHYDGGNLTSSFSRPPRLSLAWGWRF